MSQSILEIAQDGRHISLFRGFLKISEGAEEVARIPLDSIHAVLLNCYQATISQNILLACAEHNIPVVLCGSNHQPAGILLPVVGHYKQAGNLAAQLDCTKPHAKQCWKHIIQSKIMGQHQVLEVTQNAQGDGLAAMAKRVKSGDSDNLEAQAAKRYWKQLMGKTFIRNGDSHDENALLNYGYAILRATVARAVVSVGLHPSLGIHHRNRLNAFCLVDDLMEAFRPAVDYQVYQLVQQGNLEGNQESKRKLASLMEQHIVMPSGCTSISNAVLLLAQSLAASFNSKTPQLLLPTNIIPFTQQPEDG